MTVLAALIGTAVAYGVALALRRRFHSPLLNPTMIGMLLIGGLLLAAGLSYASYAHDTRVLSALMTPAVVSLAVPLHRERDVLRRYAPHLLLGVCSGTRTALAVGYAATKVFDFNSGWSIAVLSRTATSPISIALAGELHGRAALSATLTIIAGVSGAALGPAWLTKVRVHHPLARGIAHGVSSHGLGTARMVQESRLAGAASAVGMALGGTLIAVCVPLIWR